MIPNDVEVEWENELENENGFEITTEPSLTYQLDWENKKVKNTLIDEKESLKQAISKILHTERYQYAMYDWDYGVELGEFLGQDMEEVLPDIEDKIEEALTEDARIESVDYIEVEEEKGKLYILLQVSTIFGELEVETVV